uniref:50S ribosomal protein L12, chloroplastic n=1 Tax=Harveyella mirabilis TaxID=282355 RepID=A0A3S8UW47_9FLOR|nr:ribosomal protein L12 [Harveyella mirabilis]
MSNIINNIIKELKSLSLLEAVELVKQIEKNFDIETSLLPKTEVIKISEDINSINIKKDKKKIEFDVILEEVPISKKITILKVVRSLTSLGLKEAKTLVESIPKSIKENISKEEAEKIKVKLEEVGAKILIK